LIGAATASPFTAMLVWLAMPGLLQFHHFRDTVL
jgi:hypothetical protein